MTFWKVASSFASAWLISKYTYLQLEFFQDKFYIGSPFDWVSFFKLILDVLLFVAIYAGMYYLITFIQSWRMRSRYEAGLKEREKK